MKIALQELFCAVQNVRRRCPEVPLLSISWIHFKHPIHPMQLKLMESDFKLQPGRRRFLSALVHALTAFAYACYFTLRLIQIRLRHGEAIRRLSQERFDMGVKTWRFETGEGFEKDFYYGDLQQRLGLRGAKTFFLYAYPRGQGWKGPRLESDLESAQIHELALLPLSAPIRFVLSQWATAFKLWRLSRSFKGLEAKVAACATLDCLSRDRMLTGLSYSVFRRAMQIWRPKRMLTLYEGHAWEQLAWAAIREADPGCRIIAYQHTALFSHQLSMLKLLEGDRFCVKPDLVLCLGPLTAQRLEAAHPRSQLIPFGTFRKTARVPEPVVPAPERKTVLVLPEAHIEEMDLLFQTAWQAAQQLPDHTFILRCHPILPAPEQQIRSCLGPQASSIPNLEVSVGNSIEEDFSRSSVLLYRGSSSVLYAVRFGLKPIYIRERSLPDLDPLSGLNDWKEELEGVAPLVESLRRYAGQPAAEQLPQWHVASEFVRSYAIPVEDSALDRLLEATA